MRASWVAFGIALGVVAVLDGAPIARLIAVVGVIAATAIGRRLARERPRAGGAFALLVGALGVVIGFALGARFLLGGDASLRADAALTVLAAGAVLMVAGGIYLGHGIRRSWRIPATAAMAAGVVLAGLIVAPGLLATNVPRARPGPATPADLGIEYESVTVSTEDGVRLVGWYVPSQTGAAVVLRHGSSASKDRDLDRLAVLAQAGLGVLIVDSRGHGESGGEAMDFGWHGESDIRAEVDYLLGRTDVDPARIGVVGISLGGMEAIGAAGRDPRIASVVAEGVTRRQAADLAWLPGNRSAAGSLVLAINWLQTAVTSLLELDAPPPAMADSVAAATKARFLLVTADIHDERASAEHIRRRAPDRVTVWAVGGDHASGLATSPQAWTRTVVRFLIGSDTGAHTPWSEALGDRPYQPTRVHPSWVIRAV